MTSSELFSPLYTQWFKSKQLAASLREIVNTPVFKMAENVVIEQAISLQLPVGSTVEQHALRNAHRDGYFECLRNLRALTIEDSKEKPESAKPLPPPFEAYEDEKAFK